LRFLSDSLLEIKQFYTSVYHKKVKNKNTDSVNLNGCTSLYLEDIVRVSAEALTVLTAKSSFLTAISSAKTGEVRQIDYGPIDPNPSLVNIHDHSSVYSTGSNFCSSHNASE
jgi:hypothetical protein